MFTIHSLNRFYAFGIHILGSACVVSLVALLVFFCWYPGLLAYASGVGGIFLILASVDVVLGPLITLIVFNPQKKELKRDLAIVVLVQIAALLYGASVLFSARPIFLVFNADRFDVVYANEITTEKLQAAHHEDLKAKPIFGPKIIGARLPEDADKAREIMMSAVAGGDDVQLMPQYYVHFEDMKSDIKKVTKPLSDLKNFNKDNLSGVDELINRFVSKSDEIGYVPLKAKRHDIAVVVNSANSTIVEMSRLNPNANSYGVDSVDLPSILKKHD